MNFLDHDSFNEVSTTNTKVELRDIQSYYFMGIDAFNAQKMEEAASCFGRYLSRPVEVYRYQSYKFLILTLAYLKEYTKIEEVIKKCRREFELDQDILNIWGFVLYNKNNLQDAIKLYRYILFYDPENITALNGLGFSLLEDSESQNYMEALEILQNAKKYSKVEDPRILDSLGWAFFKNKEFIQAQKLLLRALEIWSNNVIIKEHLGMCNQFLQEETI